MVTLEDIGLETGCSVNTVSRALNNKPDVSAETKARVLEAARRMGYVPNTLAKSLVTRSSRALGFIAGGKLTNPLFAMLVESVERAATAAGFHLFFAHAEGSVDDVLRGLYGKRIDGLLVALLDSRRHNLADLLPFPVPTLTLPYQLSAAIPAVACDFEQAAFLGVHHLFQQQRRTLLVVLPEAAEPVAAAFRRGAARACQVTGNDLSALRFVAAEESANGGYLACQAALAKEAGLDAVFVYNDLLAPGIYTALRETGRLCPADVALAGCGNFEFSQYLHTPLTSIDLGIGDVAGRAVELLTAAIGGEASLDECFMPRPPVLVPRASSGQHGKSSAAAVAPSLGFSSALGRA